ncbi:MAG: helix-turn-helix domain-containing protein, partial [Pseudomonadota bacterium]
ERRRTVSKEIQADRYVTTKQAAEILHLTTRTLERKRMDGDGPTYCKLGPGLRARVVYRLSDLHAWVSGQARSSTCE